MVNGLFAQHAVTRVSDRFGLEETVAITIRRFKGRRVVIDGMTRFILRDGLIAEYRESVNGGVAMAQLGVEPARMEKVFRRWTGWLKERPETLDYLARPKGSRAKRQ